MQLGTRWPVGGDIPSRLSAEVGAAVRRVEADVAHLDTAQWRWTLTFLEGRPVVELDDGTVIRERADGSVTVTDPE